MHTRWAKCRVTKIYCSWYIQLPLGCSVHKGTRVKMEAAGFCKMLVLSTELHDVKSQNRVMLLVLLTHSPFRYKCILSTLSFVFCFLCRSDMAHLRWFVFRRLLMSSKVSSLWSDCMVRGCRQLLFREEWMVQCGSNCVSHRKVKELADRLDGRSYWWKFCTVACLEVNEHIRENDIIIIIIIHHFILRRLNFCRSFPNRGIGPSECVQLQLPVAFLWSLTVHEVYDHTLLTK